MCGWHCLHLLNSWLTLNVPFLWVGFGMCKFLCWTMSDRPLCLVWIILCSVILDLVLISCAYFVIWIQIVVFYCWSYSVFFFIYSGIFYVCWYWRKQLFQLSLYKIRSNLFFSPSLSAQTLTAALWIVLDPGVRWQTSSTTGRSGGRWEGPEAEEGCHMSCWCHYRWGLCPKPYSNKDLVLGRNMWVF